MTVGDVFTHRRRRQADPVFVLLDFLGHADAHDLSPFRGGRKIAASGPQVPVLFDN
jgi:hypothetical protein